MAERRRRRRTDLDPAARGLARFRRAGGPRPPEAELRTLAEAWAAVVGAPVVAQALPLRRSRAGVLTVACSSAAWAQTLSLRGHELRLALTAACPEVPVTGLRFAVADHALPPAPAPARPAPPEPPGPEARRRAAELVGEVGDAGLRDALVRAAAARLARGGRDA